MLDFHNAIKVEGEQEDDEMRCMKKMEMRWDEKGRIIEEYPKWEEKKVILLGLLNNL